MLYCLSKSSIDDQIIFKHLDKLSKGKLQLHEDFTIIEDNKATAKNLGTLRKTTIEITIREKDTKLWQLSKYKED